MAQLRREMPGGLHDRRISAFRWRPKQSAIVARIRGEWADFPQQTIDGVRIDMPDGWALVRSSVTEPAPDVPF